MVWGGLGELRRIIQRQIAVHLVGAYVVVTDAILTYCFEQTERALHIGVQERLGIGDGVVVVRFRRIMHDGVMPRHDAIQQIRIADISHDQLHAVFRKSSDVLRIACICQLVQYGDMHIRMIIDHVMYEIRSDEAAATGHNDVLGSKGLFGHAPILQLPITTPPY